MAKRTKKSHRGKRKLNKWTVLVSALLLSFVIVSVAILGYTYSSEKQSETKNNDFALGDLRTELVEVFENRVETKIGEKIEKKVLVKNTGETDQFIRVMVIPEVIKKGKDAEPDVLLPATVGKEVLLLDKDDKPITDDNYWINGKDGYFYFVRGLNVNKNSKLLFNKVQLVNVNDEYLNAELSVHLRVESIGTTKWAYRDAWWDGETPISGNSLFSIDKKLQVLVR